MPETNDAYVRKDVFDARMDRLEILIEKTATEIKAYVDKSIGEVKTELKAEISEVRTEMRELKTEIGEVKNELKLVNTRIDSLEHVMYWGIGGFAVILACAVVVTPVLGFFRKLFKPSVTVEDVQRMISEAIGTHLAGTKGGQA